MPAMMSPQTPRARNRRTGRIADHCSGYRSHRSEDDGAGDCAQRRISDTLLRVRMRRKERQSQYRRGN